MSNYIHGWNFRTIRGRWRVDETYLKIGGRWRYLYRAIDEHDQIVDVYRFRWVVLRYGTL